MGVSFFITFVVKKKTLKSPTMNTTFNFEGESFTENIPVNKGEKKLQKLKSKLPVPVPVDREIKLDETKVLVSFTDTRGVITYCNDDFVDVSGYEEYELAGAQHNIVRHPDMPRMVFKFMWDRIEKKENIIAIVKNMSKTGRYYWVMTDFVIKEDNAGNVTGYKAYRKPAPRKAIEAVTPLYQKLRRMEDASGMEAAEKYLLDFFDAQNTNYDDFIENLLISELPKETVSNETIKPITKTERKSFFKRLFGY